MLIQQVPPDLFAEWLAEGRKQYAEPALLAGFMAEKAAQWAADQELEACCDAIFQIINVDNIGFSGPAGILHTNGFSSWPAFAQRVLHELRATRRPKPPSLKEQALEALMHLENGAHHSMDTTESVDYIRRALESIPDSDS